MAPTKESIGDATRDPSPTVIDADGVHASATDTRDLAPTVLDPAGAEHGQPAAHKAESFADYLSRTHPEGVRAAQGMTGRVMPTADPETTRDEAPAVAVAPEDPADENNLVQRVKDAGIAGVISYMFWELAFWGVSVPVCVLGYQQVTGHWPDFSNQEDIAQLGAEAFAFVNVARFAVPLRIGLALGTVPWVQQNIVDRVQGRGGSSAAAPSSSPPPSLGEPGGLPPVPWGPGLNPASPWTLPLLSPLLLIALVMLFPR